MSKGAIVVVSGFSGVGKDTVVSKLLTEDSSCAKSISMTTRQKRPDEIDGQSYYFVTQEGFNRAISDGELVEYAEYQKNLYGTPKKGLCAQAENGKDVILVIEVEGALNVKRIFPDAILIFLLPPSADELERRLRDRGTDSETVILGRLERAQKEAEYIEQYEYVIVNDNVAASAKAIREIINAAKCSIGRNKGFIGELRMGLSCEMLTPSDL